MNTTTVTVENVNELAAAIAAGNSQIQVAGVIAGSPSITLPAGTKLSGKDEFAKLVFKGKGVRLSRNNTISNLKIETLPYEVAIYNSFEEADAGVLKLEKVETVGQIYLAADGNTKNIRVEADQVHVREADVRGRIEQPHGYGVDVLQGGFTLWNRQADPNSSFTATLHSIAIGTAETPVRGSGVFVAGYGDREGNLAGGSFTADLIETAEVHTDGGIAPGTPDKITGGVFVVSGAIVETVKNLGSITTHGQNDMVLDNWGEVKHWVAEAPVSSTGPSGIGFVNFGDIDVLEVNAPILTTGKGARGFNLYDGSLRKAVFESIRTTGDGSIGIQVSKPMGELLVLQDIVTTGGEGLSLVKGVQMPLKAIALSVKPGGVIENLQVAGNIRTEGAEVVTLEVTEGAKVKHFNLGGKLEALGSGSVEKSINGEIAGL